MKVCLLAEFEYVIDHVWVDNEFIVVGFAVRVKEVIAHCAGANKQHKERTITRKGDIEEDLEKRESMGGWVDIVIINFLNFGYALLYYIG